MSAAVIAFLMPALFAICMGIAWACREGDRGGDRQLAGSYVMGGLGSWLLAVLLVGIGAGVGRCQAAEEHTAASRPTEAR